MKKKTGTYLCLIYLSFWISIPLSGATNDPVAQLKEVRSQLRVIGPYGEAQMIDSLYRRAMLLAKRIPDYNELTRVYAQYGKRSIGIVQDLEKSRAYLDSAAVVLQQQEIGELRSMVAIFNAYYFNVQNQRDSCLFYIKLAKTSLSMIVTEAEKQYWQPLIHKDAADYFHQLNFYDSALANYQTAIRLFETYGNRKGHLKTLNHLAALLLTQNELPRALEIYQQLLTAAQTDANHMGMASTMANIAGILTTRHQFDSALVLYRRSYQLRKSHGGPDFEVIIALADLHALQGSSDSALYYLRSVDATRIKQNDRFFLWTGYATAYLGSGQLSKALRYNGQAMAFAEGNRNLRLLNQALEQRIKIMEAMGDYESAFKSLSRLRVGEDSIFNIEKQKSITQLETAYETNKKQQEILYLEQLNENKDLRLSSQQRIIWITVVFAVLLIAYLLLLFRQNKLSAHQKQVNLQQKLLQSQMNPHFIFNALTSIQNFILDQDTDKAIYYLARFSELTRDILENSRKEWIPLTDEIHLLESYVDLEQVRFDKDLTLVFDYDEQQIEELLIPPMMLQPFVENSIKHGFAGRDEGSIVVRLTRCTEKKKVLCEIVDDGVGLKVNLDETANSLAISITKERIGSTTLSDNQLNFSIKNKLDDQGKTSGVCVRFYMPLKYAV